jgi:hypothetical protein
MLVRCKIGIKKRELEEVKQRGEAGGVKKNMLLDLSI